ncbi:MAG: F0F1 ATP synthase subunit B [Gammaproteobacteria bacterium]|nr:F0F1 ATP synthase subunit B [Gammaproteobacteria bacterium]
MNINATLISQMISFAVFVWFCMKFVWPPLIAAIEARQKSIADGLADAARASKDLDLAQAKAKDHLRDARKQSAELLEQANRRRSQIIEEAQGEARIERDKILAQGQAELEAAINRAREELRGQVAVLALAGAEQILQRSVDAKAHADILDKLASKL